MRASRTYGSVRGAPSNGRLYRDGLTPLIGTRLAPTFGAGPPVRVAIPASETPCYRRRMASDWPPDRPPWDVWTDLLALDRERQDEVAGHGGTGRSGGHCRVARGQRRRGHDDRILGGNAGTDDSRREYGPGRAAAPSGPGADGGALPEPTPLPALWRATPAQGHPPSAIEVIVWGRGGSCSPLRSLPMRRGVAPDHLLRLRRSCPTAARRNM